MLLISSLYCNDMIESDNGGPADSLSNLHHLQHFDDHIPCYFSQLPFRRYFCPHLQNYLYEYNFYISLRFTWLRVLAELGVRAIFVITLLLLCQQII